MTWRTAAAEFPNDNPRLHDGAVWVYEDAGPLRAEWTAFDAGLGDDDPTDLEIVEALPELDDALLEEGRPGLDLADERSSGVLRAGERVEAPADDRPFARFVAALSAAARAVHGEAGAAAVGALFEDDASALARAGGDEFLRLADAWRRVLLGDGDAFAEVGARALDEWAADVLAAALDLPSRRDAFRRELRRAGVAAFGLLDAA